MKADPFILHPASHAYRCVVPVGQRPSRQSPPRVDTNNPFSIGEVSIAQSATIKRNLCYSRIQKVDGDLYN